MYRLSNTVQRYAWGSPTAIPEFLGVVPDGGPQAELWIGSHPGAPSKALSVAGEPSRSLADLIRDDPERMLGAGVADRFGELPFLLKYLAAAEPLSIQAHPSEEQARAGYEREEAAGVPRDARGRVYRDPHAKPEVLCPVVPFDVLCGFREPAQTARLFQMLAVPELATTTDALRSQDSAAGLRSALEGLVSMESGAHRHLVARVADAASAHSGEFRRESALIASLAEKYPGDLGVLIAAMLNLITLMPGQAIFLQPRTLHAYLRGVGVELMGNSDNVLRAGLTPKFVDAQELVDILDFVPSHGLVLTPVEDATGELVFETPAPEFRLSLVEVGERSRVELPQWGPDIVLCLDGAVTLEGGGGRLELAKGGSAFVEAECGGYSLSGSGRAVRACAGRP